MTNKQKEKIKDNLNAYKANFGYIEIVKVGKGFYIYTSKESRASGCWTQFCENIDYVNGWLYGAVQAANGIIKPISKDF